MNSNDEVIVLDDDDDDAQTNEYFTYDSSYQHFLSMIGKPSPIVLSDDEAKSPTKIKRRKKKYLTTSTHPYKCRLCPFGSKHRFIFNNHYQMNHVSVLPPLETILVTDDDLSPEPTPTLQTVGPSQSKIVSNSPPLVYIQQFLTCDKCDYTTGTSKDMQHHKKLHSIVYPYKCNLCNFAAVNSFTVFNHYQLNHIDGLECTPDALFECHVCGFMTEDKEAYNMHAFNCYIRKFCSVINESTTNGESFYCSMCSFKASHYFVLTNHIRMAHEFKDVSVKLEKDVYSLNTMYVIKEEFIVGES